MKLLPFTPLKALATLYSLAEVLGRQNQACVTIKENLMEVECYFSLHSIDHFIYQWRMVFMVLLDGELLKAILACGVISMWPV